MKSLLFSIIIIATLVLSAGCVKQAPDVGTWMPPLSEKTPTQSVNAEITSAAVIPTERPPGAPYYTPTPDAPHALPTLRPNAEQYMVQYGDSLQYIANKFNLELEVLIAANPLADPNWIDVGQILNIPAPQPISGPSDFKIIPDSELVNGPASTTFDIKEFVKSQDGYLSTYREKVGEDEMSGIRIVRRVSEEFSVNPRLLLALLEYRSGWVTSWQIDQMKIDYPMGNYEERYKGLYMQLSWTANQLNRGYYLWKVNAISFTPLADGLIAPLSPVVNAGTAAVQYMLGLDSSLNAWQTAVSEQGVYQTYTQFFGIPFDRAIEPLIPNNLAQPDLTLPFEDGAVWSYTSGPHAGWGSGSAWAALDFGPPGDLYGCFVTDSWITASADGVISRSENGVVVLDLDGDGFEQTGWSILYMHVETRDRIPAGTIVKVGDRIGHPSCEGGFSNGTHLHFARRYNGEWISADTDIPIVLSGWVSGGDGFEYSGTLTNGSKIVYSWDGRVDDNQIQP